MLHKVIWLIETIVLFVFSYIIPKDENLLLFGSMKTKYIWWNPKIYYLYLQNKYWKRYNILFCDPNKTNTDERILTYGSWLKKYWLILRANALIIDACSFDLWIHWVLSWKYNFIQMWHWEPIKKIGFLSDLYISRRHPIVLFFEKLEYKTYSLILSNPWSIEFIKWCFQNNNVQWIWVPRNDLLLHKDILDLMKNKIVEKQIAQWQQEYKKVILLAPTFRETDSSDYFTKEEAQQLNKVLKQKNYLLIIKTHPNEQRAFLHENYSHLQNVTQTMNYDATDFTPFVDAVTTDYSSIYIDFLLTWREVIFYQKDLDDYINKERWLLYKPEQVVIKESTAYNFDELMSIFSQLDSISAQEEYKKWYAKLYDLFFKWLERDISTCEKLDALLLKK